MATKLNPYLNFRTESRQAMEFYREVLGGELTISTFGEFPGTGEGDHAAPADGVMHAQLLTPAGFTLMASDLPPGMEADITNTSISLSGDDADELRGYWEKLAAAGTVTLPLEKQMWGDEFGMVTDQFGIHWMVNIAASA